MTKLGFFSAAAVLSMVAATPVFADNLPSRSRRRSRVPTPMS
jgi:hypothetical protein